MRVIVNGLKGEVSESVRDCAAMSIVQSLKKFDLPSDINEIQLSFGEHIGAPRTSLEKHRSNKNSESDNSEKIDLNGLVSNPRSNCECLRLDGAAQEAIAAAISRFNVRALVYDKWGLSSVDPVPRLSLNFSGAPGTGKTLAAHYIAKSLGKKIIEVSYADVVSKYFGEAAKNLSKLYEFAVECDAVLFVDEAETLLSRRGESSAGGVDHAVNSMRSQLLILMERSPIISIFATNLVNSYDTAFLSRMITVHFPMPNLDARSLIWEAHLPQTLPLEHDIAPEILANRFDGLNGRQISRGVVEAAHRAACRGAHKLSLEDFDWAVGFVTSQSSEANTASSQSMA